MNNKSQKLGVPLQTARGRLLKELLFQSLKELNKNYCYRCGVEIESKDDLTIDHKEDWIDSDNPLQVFSDINNIAYSHFECNTKARRKKGVKHPSHRAYNEGCRCDECKAVEAERKRKQRKKKNHEQER
jgi:DNA phosphorothioation-dependent restriction protein DptG